MEKIRIPVVVSAADLRANHAEAARRALFTTLFTNAALAAVELLLERGEVDKPHVIRLEYYCVPSPETT